MLKRYMPIFTIILVLTAISGCAGSSLGSSKGSINNKNNEITVSAAASMKDAMTKIKKLYEKQTHQKVVINFASSGTLQHQIEQGAPVDLFLSASTAKMNTLLDKNLIDKADVKKLLKNDIVLIVPKGEPSAVHSLKDLTKDQVKKVSIGIPESVPAGRYAKETLISTKLWQALQKKLVLAKDVRQVLDYVETGNVDAGLVYHTDALITNKVKIVQTVNESTHSPIIYPVGIVKDTQHKKEAVKFYKFLQTKQAQEIFKQYGFKIFKS